MAVQPTGTVTLVFTDIEGSTRLLQELGREAYREVLVEHRRVVREACAHHAGYEVDAKATPSSMRPRRRVGCVNSVPLCEAPTASLDRRDRLGGLIHEYTLAA